MLKPGQRAWYTDVIPTKPTCNNINEKKNFLITIQALSCEDTIRHFKMSKLQ